MTEPQDSTRDDHPVAHVQCPATHELRGRCQFIGYPNELTWHAETRSHVDGLSVHWDEPAYVAPHVCGTYDPECTCREAPELAYARYLGADAALCSYGWLGMSEADARSILSDVDPEVMDRYPEPTVGYWETEFGESLREQVDADVETTGPDELADAWEEGRDAVWSDALQATALRVLGDIQSALELERDIENRVDALRIKSERATHAAR